VLGETGQLLAMLKRREPAIVTKSDRCRLVFSSPDRVQIIRRVFELFVDRQLNTYRITVQLNREGIPTARGPGWSARCCGLWREVTIENILRNPAYAGDLVWNRRTLAKFFRIGQNGVPEERTDTDVRRTSRNDVELWVRASNCHPAIVSRKKWDLAQGRLLRS
jgi:hypothetical protein